MSTPYRGNADPTHQAPVSTKFFRADTQEEFINVDGGTTWKRIVKEDDSFAGLDSTAIHKDVPAEISTVTEKTAPDGDDAIIIEDSADSNNKKRVLVKNLPGGGASLGTSWRFDSGVADADPGTRRFRFNDATQADATQIFVNDEAVSGADLSAVIAQLKSGDRIYIQQLDDSAKFHLANVTGVPTDAGTYWKIPITITDSGADLVNNQVCAWVLFFSSENVGDTLPVVDTTSIVKGSVDDTKEIRLEADGITTGTTRVLTMPDKDVTVDDVNDPRTDPDAIHVNVAAEIDGIALKATPAGADQLVIEDSADSNNKKKTTAAAIAASGAPAAHTHVEADITDLDHTDPDAIHDNVAGEISAVTQKGTPVDGDHLLIEDSEAGDAKKRILLSDLPSGGAGVGEVICVHDGTGGQTFAGSLITVNLDSIHVNSDAATFDLTADVLTVKIAGTYFFSFQTSGDASSPASSGVRMLLERDTGGGFVEVGGSRAGSNIGDSGNDDNWNLAATIALVVAADDKFRVRVQRSTGAATYRLLADHSRFNITQIKKA